MKLCFICDNDGIYTSENILMIIIIIIIISDNILAVGARVSSFVLRLNHAK